MYSRLSLIYSGASGMHVALYSLCMLLCTLDIFLRVMLYVADFLEIKV